MDYADTYTEYWRRPDRWESHSFNDPEPILQEILSVAGTGSVLDVGCGMGLLVRRLVGMGVDAQGVDVAPRVVAQGNQSHPGRFFEGSILALPFPDHSFATVMTTDCLEHLTEADVPKALRELYRVAADTLYVRLATTPDRDRRWHLCIHDRAWWETRFFEAGFRKHPQSQTIVPYESLAQDDWQITLVLEKIPALALARYPSPWLNPESDLRRDILRETGEGSDAPIARYQLAARHVRPGDTVLDLGCGSGAGVWMLRRGTRAARIIGVDPSAAAIAYARAHFGAQSPRVEFRAAGLLEALRTTADSSIHFITCFGLLDGTEDRPALVAELARVLAPGGRVFFSVANGWMDSDSNAEPGIAPLRWPALESLIRTRFLLEGVHRQIARRCWSVKSRGWQVAPRQLRAVSAGDAHSAQAEWWLVLAMKDPVCYPVPEYRETVFQGVAPSGHASLQYAEFYQNPWVVHSLVHAGYRSNSPAILVESARRILQQAPAHSADAGAALCLLLYRAIEGALAQDELPEVIGRAQAYLSLANPNPHQLRWQVSLSYAVALLHMRWGRFVEARRGFDDCAGRDALAFSTHLTTKTTEACFLSGWLALTGGDPAAAKRAWQGGLGWGERILARPLSDTLMNPEWPNLFDDGDGMREVIYALENVARCANGLHCLRLMEQGLPVSWDLFHNTFRFQRDIRDVCLRQAQSRVEQLCREVNHERAALRDRSAELEQSRSALHERGAELDRDRAALRERGGEVNAERAALRECRIRLQAAETEAAARGHDAARWRLLCQHMAGERKAGGNGGALHPNPLSPDPKSGCNLKPSKRA